MYICLHFSMKIILVIRLVNKYGKCVQHSIRQIQIRIFVVNLISILVYYKYTLYNVRMRILPKNFVLGVRAKSFFLKICSEICIIMITCVRYYDYYHADDGTFDITPNR